MKKRYIAVPLISIALALLLAVGSVLFLSPFSVQYTEDFHKSREQTERRYQLTNNTEALERLILHFYSPLYVAELKSSGENIVIEDEKAYYQQGADYVYTYYQKLESGEIEASPQAMPSPEYRYHPILIYMLYKAGKGAEAEQTARDYWENIKNDKQNGSDTSLALAFSDILEHETISPTDALWMKEFFCSVLTDIENGACADENTDKRMANWQKLCEKLDEKTA